MFIVKNNKLIIPYSEGLTDSENHLKLKIWLNLNSFKNLQRNMGLKNLPNTPFSALLAIKLLR
jgi:hypothetical protein